MLTVSDWAGSGFKTCQAINQYSDHNIQLIALKGNIHGHPRENLITKTNKKYLCNIVNKADIIHLKGDWPPGKKYIDFDISKKPIVVSTSGGFFRKKIYGGRERYKCSQYKCNLKTSYTPDLLYPEYSDIWTPHPIDSMGKENIWKWQDVPLLIHSPSDRKAKDTDFLLQVIKKLRGKINIEFEIIEKVTFREAVELRKRATLFLDEFKQGFYANSAIESMQYGIPQAAWISPLSIKQAKGQLDNCPVLTTNKNVDNWVNILTNALNPLHMELLSKQTKEWCDKIHSYQSIARLWDKLYKTI